MTHIAFANFESFIIELSRAAEKVAMKYYRKAFTIHDKNNFGNFDPVSVADKEAEKAVRSLINGVYPSHGIIGEEFGSENETSQYVWVIDPIDGTKAFITGMPTWGILISLLKDGVPILGVNNQPALKEVFIGNNFESKKIDANGVSILKTRSCKNLEDAIVLVSSAIVRDEPFLKKSRALAKKVKMLEYSANCYSCAMLAEGNIDIVIGFGNFEIFDIAAHIPIISGAGGLTSSFDGSNVLNANSMISCGDPSLLSKALFIINNN